MISLPPSLHLPNEVLDIVRRLEEAGFEAWCVGGALRDALLGDPHDDVDIATAARPEQVQGLFRRTVPVGVKFGTVGVLDGAGQLHEVTTFRRDVSTDGRHPVVEYGVSLEDDLARRDFTINALAYHPLRPEWRDPFRGVDDLGRGVVRAVGDPAARFREDYLRILRAIRFAARFGFEIEPVTWAAAIAGAGGLERLSAERVKDEWFRGLESAKSVRRLVSLWREVGAAAVWLAGLRPEYPLASDDPAPRQPVVLTAVLCEHPAAVLERLRASNAEIERAARMAAAPANPESLDDAGVRRWLARVSRAADDLLLARQLLTGEPAGWLLTVGRIRERGDPLTRGALALTGDDLRAAGIPAGPRIGVILERLLELVLEDPDRNRREVLLDLAGKLP